MGKRKTAKKQMKKEKPKLMSKFDCPFCNHAGSIKITMNKKGKAGECKCITCNESYSTTITALTEPIDLYCEWIDACEEANANPKSGEPGQQSQGGRGRGAAARRRGGRDDDDDDDDNGGGADDDEDEEEEDDD